MKWWHYHSFENSMGIAHILSMQETQLSEESHPWRVAGGDKQKDRYMELFTSAVGQLVS